MAHSASPNRTACAWLVCALVVLASSAHARELHVEVTGAGGQPLRYSAVMAGWADAAPPHVSSRPETMSQHNLQFVPHMLIVPLHASVAFPNQDDTRHHVYSFSRAKTFDIKLYVGRPKHAITFDQAGVVSLGCNIHDHMQAYIVVTDDPRWAITDAAGQTVLRNLPATPVTLKIWHPWMTGEDSRVKRVLNSDTREVHIALDITAPPKAPQKGTSSLQDRFNQLSR